MKLLVTGSAGFIAYHVIKRLINDGHQVVGIDNLLSRRDTELKQVRLKGLGVNQVNMAPGLAVNGLPGFSFIKMDLLDRNALLSLCEREKFDAVIHLAAVAGSELSAEKPLIFADNNIAGTANILEAARLGHVGHFFFSSSSVVHGRHAHAPMKEQDDIDTPLSMYAASKRAAELLCYAYAQTHRLPVTIFRFFTVFGSWCRPNSTPMLLARDIVEGNEITILNEGYIVRDFTYVDDIVDGVLSALGSPPMTTLGEPPYEVYNIGSAKPVPYLSFIQSLETALGCSAKLKISRQSPIEQGETIENYADTGKLEANLAYSPTWDYAEATPLFARWFLENYNITFHM